MNGTASSGSATRSRLDVGLGPHRLRDDGADVLDQLHVDAHPEHREHDVREHHGRVDAVGAHGLQRDLGAELGLPADLEQRVLLADLAVPRQRPSGLAHEPDGGPLDGLQASRSDEKWRALELRRQLVVDPPEDERGECERADRRLTNT